VAPSLASEYDADLRIGENVIHRSLKLVREGASELGICSRWRSWLFAKRKEPAFRPSVIEGGSTTELRIVVPILATEALSAGATPLKRLG
jgi:hypothetical protein